MTTVFDPAARDAWRATARTLGPIDFELPRNLEATRPPEERGVGRDDVRLLVARRTPPNIEHHRFGDLPQLLKRGDVLVINTSATLPASLEARTPAGTPAEVHLSTRDPERSTDGLGGRWVVELRHAPAREFNPDRRRANAPWLDAAPGTVVRLPAGGAARLLAPATNSGRPGTPTRLWIADLDLPLPTFHYLTRHGRPIRYGDVADDRPLGAYQTIFAADQGSAEMPSAARPFSPELVTRLVTRGIQFAPLTLHAGVSSPEADEPPTAEWYRVPTETAELVNLARHRGHRVIAVGTTAVRALETATSNRGVTRTASGWSTLVITAERGVRGTDGLITGWHEPRASHLAMLEAIGGRPLLEASYREALAAGYLWHEFGDSHLIMR